MGQVGDQSVKGGVLGVAIYFMSKYNMDPALIAMLTPMIAAVMAVASKKIGDPEIASFFGNAKPVDESAAA
jgi:hypothetical protein